MAVRRIDPNYRKKVVSMMDSAVDIAKTDAAGYATTLDLSKVAFVEGENPTYFLISPIAPLAELEINDAHQKIIPPRIDEKTGKPIKASIIFERQGEMSLKYFKHCVKALEEDGKELPVDDGQFNLSVLQEIGSYAMLFSRAGDKLKKT